MIARSRVAAACSAAAFLAAAALVPASAHAARCKDGETKDVASYELTKGEALENAINEPLTETAGDPKAGLKWMTHRRLGNCIACHTVQKILDKAEPGNSASLAKYGFHGEIAPPLDGVADRYTEGELRLIVVDVKKAFPGLNSIMPAFHVGEGYTRVHKDCAGMAILSAQRVEDVVAYLKTLKE